MEQSQTLKKDSLGIGMVVAQSLTTVAPLMDLIAFITTAALYAYGALPLAFLLAFIATFLSINTIFQFSKKIASSGGYYTFVGKGLGARPGIFTGWLYLIYTWFIVPNEALFFGALFFPAAFQLLTGIALPALVWIPMTLILIIFVFGMSYLGIKPSLKYSLITGILEVLVILVFSFVVMGKSGPLNTPSVFSLKFSQNGWNGVLLGMIFSVISFGGSGTPVTLGEEAKLPHKSIGRAVIISMLISGITITIAAYALTIGWGPSKMASFGIQLIPGIIEAKTFMGLAGAAVITILGVNSFFNSALSSFNAGVRTTFAIARDGVLLPTRLAKVHAKFGSPYSVIFLNIVISTILAIPLAYLITPLNAFLIEVTGVTVSYFLYHIMTNVSLGVYFKRIGELSILKHVVIPWVATLFFAVILYYSIVPISYPVGYGTFIIAAWAVIGIIIALTLKKERLAKSELFISYEAGRTESK